MKYEYQNKSVIGMLNAEIYNYKEIKENKKKDIFRTESDTEVFYTF